MMQHHLYWPANSAMHLNQQLRSGDVSCRRPKEECDTNLDQVFSDAPAIEGILAAHHFHVHNGATVAYPLSKDI